MGEFGPDLLDARRVDRHPGWGGLPHKGDLGWGETAGLVDDVAQRALPSRGFGGEGAGGSDRAGEFVAQRLEAVGGEKMLLAAEALYFADPGVGV